MGHERTRETNEETLNAEVRAGPRGPDSVCAFDMVRSLSYNPAMPEPVPAPFPSRSPQAS